MAGDDRVYLRLSTGRNTTRVPVAAGGRVVAVRDGSPGAPVVLAVGPVLDAVLAGTAGLDVTVAYTHTPRPLDVAGLRELAGRDLVLVEPYLAGTSARVVADALADRPHRLLSLGVGRRDLRRYGSPGDHAAAHGLDAAGIRRSVTSWLD